MSYKAERDEEFDLTRLTLSGRIDYDHLVEALRSLLTLPGHNWQLLMIYEPDTEFELSAEDIRRLSNFIAEERPSDAPPGRTAIVAPTDLIFGLTRMHQVFVEDLPVDPQVFRRVEDALVWLLAR